MATKVAATTAPEVWNGRVMPKVSSSQGPSSPRRPKPSSSATPPTVGGSTIGSSTSERTSALPGKWTRASSQASGTPRTRDSPSAQKETSSESRSASVTPGLVRWAPSSPHSVRARMPTSGSSRNAMASSAGTARASGRAGAGGAEAAHRRFQAAGVGRRSGCGAGAAGRLLPGRGAPGHSRSVRSDGHGFWKPASRRIFCASGVLSQVTKRRRPRRASDGFRVAAG